MSLTKIKIKPKSTPLPEHKSENVTIQAVDIKTKLKVSLRTTSSEPLSKQFPIRPRSTLTKEYINMSLVEKGDNLVWKVYDTLSRFDNILEIANISGISGNQFDIAIRTKDGQLRGIQVKTLIKTSVTEQYNHPVNNCTYPDQTLMVFANSYYNRFVITQWQNIKHKSLLWVNFLESENDPIITKFKNYDEYTSHLYQQVPQALQIFDIRQGVINPYKLLEYDFVQKVKNTAEKLGIKFEYENTDGSPIDFYLNNNACQAKTSGAPIHASYHVHMRKRIKGKESPYTDNDGIQYFIIGINDDQYQNDILIVPIKHLIQQGYIKTDNQSGIMSLYLHPPGYCKYHWLKSMWNNWEIIKKNLSFVTDPISNFLDTYNGNYMLIQTSQKNCTKHVFAITKSSFDDDNIKYYMVILNDGTTQLYSDWIWILPKSDLMGLGKVPTLNLPRVNFLIGSPYYNGKCWSMKYWQKIN
jgi:hypothetical protein